ncbi:MAG: alanine racemase [Alphaproteobacteria bacterium]|nr:alanine racemase [Alphaproteobacteria bacterium]
MDARSRQRHSSSIVGPMNEAKNEGSDFQAARLTVRLPAIVANYRTYRRMAGPTAVAAVVKADGYGLGAGAIAPALAAAGCDSFFVARLEEGIALRKVVPQARIFVLDGAHADAVPALISFSLTPVLNSLGQIAAWGAAAGVGASKLDAVLQVDTGMNRLGLPGDELAILSGDHARRLAGLNLVLVMSHLACADEPANAMNAEQLSRFQQALAMLPPAPASLAASHGAMLGMEYHFDLVRPGVALYGANPQAREGTGPKKGEDGATNLMQTAAVLTAKVLQVRRIDSGNSVGYAATFRAKRPTMIATVALGYADGIPRTLSGKGVAVLGGVRVPIAGRVSMDMITLDVSDLAEPPRVGDEVELLGDTLSLGEVAAMAGTNEYEILTRLRRVPRIYEDQ